MTHPSCIDMDSGEDENVKSLQMDEWTDNRQSEKLTPAQVS